MILALAIVVALVVARMRGGELGALGRVPLRWAGLAVVAFALQAALIYQPAVVKVTRQWGWSELVFVGSQSLLLAVVWVNRRAEGMWWIGLGLLLNAVAIVSNGGWMPVTADAITQVGYASLVPGLPSGLRFPNSKNIVLAPTETRLALLTDVFVLPRPFPVPSVFSIGDVLIAFGAFAFIQDAMVDEKTAKSP